MKDENAEGGGEGYRAFWGVSPLELPHLFVDKRR